MSSPPALPDPGEHFEVAPSELKAILDSDPSGIQLIDCREDDEWHLCRIEGARLVPLSGFAQSVADWPSEARPPIVVYCHHGMRSMQATQFLRAKGFDNTFSLAGGIDAWSAEIDPGVPRY